MAKFICAGILMTALVFTSCIKNKMNQIDNSAMIQDITRAEEVREEEQQLKEIIEEREEERTEAQQ
ncbi:MAG: hypothetical protein LBR47_07695 [Spirochaetaceae bacterium]|jgi:predicted Holliday junction resolvase-like endonuclease|nr:hypothetical protein [Spirochaetaceae bacterium]